MYYSSYYTCNLGEPERALKLSLLQENRCSYMYVCMYMYVSAIRHPHVVLVRIHVIIGKKGSN